MAENKIAVVTGGSAGIGEATARALAADGWTVYVAARRAEEFERIAAEIGGVGVGLDVTDQASVDELAARLDRVDLLVNNAGADVFSDPLQLTDADWQRCLDLNLKGAWNLCKAALPAMVAAGAGSIVNIASVHGHKIIPHAFPYPVAKHGLIGMTKALGIEYAAHGVRVNSISPGLILVPRIEAWFEREPGARERQTALLPPGRIGTPQEVAYTALFLASDEARFINATDILIDGGRSQLYHE